jgi:hypothetical protein
MRDVRRLRHGATPDHMGARLDVSGSRCIGRRIPDLYEPFPPTTVPHALVIGVLCFMWCKSHARGLGVAPPSGSALLCGLFAPVGIPVYLVRVKGLKAGLVSSFKALLIAVAAFASYFGAEAITLSLRAG